MRPRPVLGTFGVGLSYGLPAGVAVTALLAVISEDPDVGFLTWVGILVSVAVALLAMALAKRRHHG
jgi:hypothetical protein